MKIVVKKVGQNPEVMEIENDFRKMQEIVGGYADILKLSMSLIIFSAYVTKKESSMGLIRTSDLMEM